MRHLVHGPTGRRTGLAATDQAFGCQVWNTNAEATAGFLPPELQERKMHLSDAPKLEELLIQSDHAMARKVA
jgi:hypothetical protein